MDHGAAALGAGGEVLYANDILCRLLGKSLAEIQGGSVLDSLPPSTHREVEELLKSSRTGKQTAEVMIERDGKERFFRSEEHTSELQSLMRISYAVFCLKKKKNKNTKH